MLNKSLKCLTRSGFAIAACLFGTSFINASDLRQDISVADRLITVGDIFTEAGDAAGIAVLEAPAPGKSKSLSAHDLSRIAEQYELAWERPDYLKRISVSRLSATIQPGDLADLVLETAIEQGANPDSMVRFFGRNKGLVVPVDASIRDVEFEQFSFSSRQNRFSAVIKVPSGSDVPNKMTLSGTIDEVRDIPVFNRSIVPGETVSSADVSWMKVPATKINGRAILTTKQLVGMTVRRAIRPDRPIMSNDVMTPVAVDKGAAVTMTVRSGAMILTAAGRALEDGSIGETIRVLNSKSRLTVDARVVSKGQVEIVAAPSLAINGR